jgi:hypothetical protein
MRLALGGQTGTILKASLRSGFRPVTAKALCASEI